MAEVSVIIPTENSADCIDAVLLSVFTQSKQDTEIILVDNASKDGTIRLIERYAEFDKRIKFVKLPRKTNLVDCCRIGVENATAPYVYFINGTKHVYVAQGCLFRLLNNIQKNDTDMVYSSCVMMNSTTFQPIPLYQISKKDFTAKGIFNINDVPEKMLFRLYLSPWAKLYKRKFLQKITWPKFEETFFLECLFKAKKISCDLNNLYYCNFSAKDLEMPNAAKEERANLKLLYKYKAFERFKTAYIYHKMRCLWLAIMRAPDEQKENRFSKLKTEFANEDFSQYDFNVLRKEELYWAVQNAKNLEWKDFKEVYIGSAA